MILFLKNINDVIIVRLLDFYRKKHIIYQETIYHRIFILLQ